MLRTLPGGAAALGGSGGPQSWVGWDPPMKDTPRKEVVL